MKRKTLTPLQEAQIRKIGDKLNAAYDYEIIPVQVMEESREKQCYANVDEKIRLSGGTVHYGWSVHFNDGYLIEAERHAIWENKQGELLCVTPHPQNYDTVIFISDNTPVDPQTDVDNVRMNITANPLVDDWIMIRNTLGDFYNRFSSSEQDARVRHPATTSIRRFKFFIVYCFKIVIYLKIILLSATPYISP